jgi:hypothetical protein
MDEIFFLELRDADSRLQSSSEAEGASYLRLPRLLCETCGVDYQGPSLPSVSQSLPEIPEASRSTGLPDQAVTAMSSAAEGCGSREFLGPAEFLSLAEMIRSVARIDERFPIRSRARIEPFRLTARHLGKRAYVGGEDDDTILVDCSAMERLEGLTGLSFSPCVSPAGLGATELWEAAVTGVGTNLMTEEQINEFWLEAIGLEDPDNDSVRCPLCQRLPERVPLLCDQAMVTDNTNVFRLKDFSGIYVDSKGRKALEGLFPDDLAFWTIA